MHHLTPRAPPICRKDHPCIERSVSHFQLFPLTMGDRRWARAGRAVPPLSARISWPGDKLGEGRRWNLRGCPGGAAGVAGARSGELFAGVLAVAWERPSGSVGGPLGLAACRLMWCQIRAMPGAER